MSGDVVVNLNVKPKFEYHTEIVPITEDKSVGKLNEIGADGWELKATQGTIVMPEQQTKVIGSAPPQPVPALFCIFARQKPVLTGAR